MELFSQLSRFSGLHHHRGKKMQVSFSQASSGAGVPGVALSPRSRSLRSAAVAAAAVTAAATTAAVDSPSWSTLTTTPTPTRLQRRAAGSKAEAVAVAVGRGNLKESGSGAGGSGSSRSFRGGGGGGDGGGGGRGGGGESSDDSSDYSDTSGEDTPAMSPKTRARGTTAAGIASSGSGGEHGLTHAPRRSGRSTGAENALGDYSAAASGAETQRQQQQRRRRQQQQQQPQHLQQHQPLQWQRRQQPEQPEDMQRPSATAVVVFDERTTIAAGYVPRGVALGGPVQAKTLLSALLRRIRICSLIQRERRARTRA